MTDDAHFKNPVNTILYGDALQIMPQMPAESVDLIVADPPYNLQLDGNLLRPNLTEVDAVNDAWDQFQNFTDYDVFTYKWLMQARRLMKPRSSIWVSGTYHNVYRVGSVMQDIGFWVLNMVTWFKPNGMPNFRGMRLKNDVEFVIWAARDADSQYTFNHHLAKRFNDYNPGKQLGSVWQIKSCIGPERLRDLDGSKLHSTQKPEELLRRIILSSSAPGDLVFDPFIGTGTTAAVARRYHRRWCGIEREPRYHAVACERVEKVEPVPLNHPDLRIPRKRPKVLFKHLVRKGYLKVGQHLYFDSPECVAVIREDGQLQAGDIIGTMHQVCKTLKNAQSSNGWHHWYFVDEHGERVLIDKLRDVYARQHRR